MADYKLQRRMAIQRTKDAVLANLWSDEPILTMLIVMREPISPMVQWYAQYWHEGE